MGRPPAVGLPSCLHAATGMEEVGWWGDPREGFILTKPYITLDFCFQVTSATDFGNIGSDGAATSAQWEVALPAAGESFGLPGRAYKLGLRRVPLDRLGGASYSSHSRCYKAVSHSGCYKPVQASLKVCGWSDQP